MTIQFKTLRFADMQVEVKAAADGSFGSIEGYASTFGGAPDSYGDIIAKGAFVNSLKQRMPKMLYQHNSGMLPSVWTDAAEDPHGLYVKGSFINTPLSSSAALVSRSITRLPAARWSTRR